MTSTATHQCAAALPWTLMAYHACLQSTLPGAPWLSAWSHPARAPAYTHFPGTGCHAGLLPRSCDEGRVGLACHAPGSPVLPLQALCHRPLPSPHRGANGMRVSALEEAPGDAPALRDSPRGRGEGVWCRWQTTALCQRRQAGQEECQSVMMQGSPRQVLVALRRHRGGARGGAPQR
jgi:hypothetical protein